jgi:hypothetical protein
MKLSVVCQPLNHQGTRPDLEWPQQRLAFVGVGYRGSDGVDP